MTGNPALWEFLEHYYDFLVNGVDLISFLLVTPEIVLLVRPLIQGKSGVRILRASAGIFTAYVTMFGGNTFRLYMADEFFLLSILARFFPFLAGTFVFITFDFWKERVMSSLSHGKLSSLFSFNLLFVGAMLFFIARMLAFAVASHKTFGIP